MGDIFLESRNKRIGEMLFHGGLRDLIPVVISIVSAVLNQHKIRIEVTELIAQQL